MRRTLTSLDSLKSWPNSTIIDVRSPSEFAEDHIQGAINLPVLNDEERAEVGTVYVQRDSFLARKMGAALVSRNIASHLEGPLREKDGGFYPLVYCWRGGMRSGSFASVLEQVGWRVDLLEGGYQSYRREVVAELYKKNLESKVILLDGNTGSAKTAILPLLDELGVQTLDLEGMANHRGSLFGAYRSGQPSQKAFESRLALAVTELDPTRPVVVEAESSKVGDIVVPPSIWGPMRRARRVRVAAPLKARARYLLTAYSDIVEDKEQLLSRIHSLSSKHSKERIASWVGYAHEGAFEELAMELMQYHYDPRYKNGRQSKEEGLVVVEAEDLRPQALKEVAQKIAKVVKEMAP